jgi:glycosyltransferase involved in cell wall biosynthesis
VKKSIIIPVYNEEGNIGNLIKNIKNLINEDDELIIVDDGSTDNTNEEIRSHGCKLVTLNKNKGKGAAMKAGIKVASRDLIVFMGGDGQDNPSEMDILVSGIVEGNDYVIGSRFIQQGQHQRYSKKAILPINEFGNKFLTFLINFMFGQNITDSQSEFKCFKSEKLKKLKLVTSRYEIETELLIRSFRKGYKIKEVPVHRYERKFGKSKLFDVPFGRFKFGLKVLYTIFKGYLFWR